MSLVVHRLSSIASTQDAARRLAEAGEAGPGVVVVADEQTNGRGRFGRAWLSPIGGLYATYVVDRHPVISLRVGVAMTQVLARYGVEADLKWPNDVLIGARKLAGVLIETHADIALVGIGLNMAKAPLETAICLQEVGCSVGRGDLVVAIGEELEIARTEDEIVDAYRERLSTLGRSVRVSMKDGALIEGTAAAVDADGRLIVRTNEGRRTIASGECQHLTA
jgi:BirA family biotin operon repressor/biotin-[acetyl-CoA-carboxylase] ligase